MKSTVPGSNHGQPLRRRIGAMAAIAVLALLVGSLLAVLSFVHQRGNSTTSASTASTPLGVYVGSGDGALYKLDAKSGVLRWRFKTQGRAIPAPAAVVGGVVYVGSLDGNVYALSAESGMLLWHFQTGGPVLASPVIHGDVVYVGSSDSHLYALDAKTGSLFWSYFAGEGAEVVNTSTVAVVKGVVYGSSSDNINHSHLFALDAKDGSLLWRSQVKNQLFTSPQVVKDVVFVASSAMSQIGGPTRTDSYVYAFKAKDGSQFWRSDKVPDVIRSSPTVVDGAVYFGSQDTNVYALSADTGSLFWRHNVGGAVYASPRVVSGVVYVGVTSGTFSNNYIAVLSATNGSAHWQHALTNYAGTNLAVNATTLYVGTSDGTVYALNTADGAQLWSYKDTIFPSNTPITVAP